MDPHPNQHQLLCHQALPENKLYYIVLHAFCQDFFKSFIYIPIEKPASAFRDGLGKAAEEISFRVHAEANDPQLALTW